MLISMVVVFGICWLPLNIINLLADLDFFPIYCWEYYHLMFFVCHVMAMSSTCYNPFLYGVHNEAFQKEFIKMIPALTFICGGPVVENENNLVLHNRNQAENRNTCVDSNQTLLKPTTVVQNSNTNQAEIKLLLPVPEDHQEATVQCPINKDATMV